MVNKCVAFGCKTGYDSHINMSTFRYPHTKPALMEKWIKFVNRSDWIPTNNSVLCVKHFKEEFISKGKRNNLKWSLHPVPTIHSDEVMKRPSCLPNTNVSRKAPTDRNFQEDELRSFISADTIRSFDDLDEKCCPRSFQF